MKLREILMDPGILSSQRVSRLSPFAQLFYRNLMHACDGGGVFENDPLMLCTHLYPRALDRVKPKTIATWLIECQGAGLVRFYTDDKGRSLGEYATWLQRDTKRRRRFAQREHTPGELPQLFSHSPPGSRDTELNGREVPPTPSTAGGSAASPIFRTTDTRAMPARRVRRLPKLADLREEKAEIDKQITEILRPGGCAFNVMPTGEKKIRCDKLMQESKELDQAMKNVRAAHIKETAA